MQRFSEIEIESQQDVFYLDAKAKAFATLTIEHVDDKIDQMKVLVNAIFNRFSLNLLYQGNANTTANETFHSQEASCLPMSIMTYTLVCEAGFEGDFQEIQPHELLNETGMILLTSVLLSDA